MDSLQQISDQELLKLCEKLGKEIMSARKRFAMLLIEVNKRQIYRKKYSTIYEFAARFAGMNRLTVVEILKIGKRIENKPLLKEVLPEVGWTKIRAALPLLKLKTEAEVVRLIKKLPRKAVIQLNQNLKGHSPKNERRERVIKLRNHDIDKFKLAKHKAEMQLKQKLTDAEFVMHLINTTEAVNNKSTRRRSPKQKKIRITRYIPAEMKRAVQQKQGGLCANPSCERVATEFHHIQPYSIQQKHKDNLVALCKTCHQLKHLLTENPLNHKYQKRFWARK